MSFGIKEFREDLFLWLAIPFHAFLNKEHIFEICFLFSRVLSDIYVTDQFDRLFESHNPHLKAKYCIKHRVHHSWPSLSNSVEI